MHFFTLRHLFIPIPDLSDLTQQTGMFFLFQISEEPDCNTHHGDQLQQTINCKTITYPKKFHHFPFNNSLEPLIPAEIDRFSSII